MMQYHSDVRTTVKLDDDVAAAVAELRARRGIGLSEALNELVRTGLTVPTQRRSFIQETAQLNVQLDVSNIADALEVLDGPAWH